MQSCLTAVDLKIQEAEDIVLIQTDLSLPRQMRNLKTEPTSFHWPASSSAPFFRTPKAPRKRLEKKASISATNLGKAKDSRLVALYRGTHKMAVPLTQALKPCKITADKVASLKTQTDDYKKSYTKPRQAISNGKGPRSDYRWCCGRP